MKTQTKSIPVQRPQPRKSSCSIFSSLTALAAGLALFGGQSSALAQVDDFNSGTLNSAWTKYVFNPALVSFTFPTSGDGKALRIQANPFPGAAPAAGAIAQTNTYTDFYVALDVVAWAELDQALVLLGQWTPAGAAGLAEGTGMILNYDVLQDGEGAGDRKGGQLQINAIFPGSARRAGCPHTSRTPATSSSGSWCCDRSTG